GRPVRRENPAASMSSPAAASPAETSLAIGWRPATLCCEAAAQNSRQQLWMPAGGQLGGHQGYRIFFIEAMARQTSQVEIQGKQLSLSNLQKMMYPAAGFTKAQVIDYYVRVAPVLLPHLRGRPLTMKRYPEGVAGMHFYEKNCPTHRPEWVTTAPIWSEGNNRWMDYCMVQDLPTLVWAANLADLELHTSLSLAKKIQIGRASCRERGGRKEGAALIV